MKFWCTNSINYVRSEPDNSSGRHVPTYIQMHLYHHHKLPPFLTTLSIFWFCRCSLHHRDFVKMTLSINSLHCLDNLKSDFFADHLRHLIFLEWRRFPYETLNIDTDLIKHERTICSDILVAWLINNTSDPEKRQHSEWHFLGRSHWLWSSRISVTNYWTPVTHRDIYNDIISKDS